MSPVPVAETNQPTKSTEKRKEEKEKKKRAKIVEMELKRKREESDEDVESVPEKAKKQKKEKREEEEVVEVKTKKKKKDKKEKKEKKDKKDKKDKKSKKEKTMGGDLTTNSTETSTPEPTIVTPIGSYTEQPSLLAVSQSTIDAFLKEHSIDVRADRPLRPILEFSQAGFTADLLKTVKSFSKPTPIQSTCWPHILAGKDITGIAETGSGKTLAFTLPALTHIRSQRVRSSTTTNPKGPTILVVAPTRELAMQSQEQAEAAGEEIGIRSVCIYGGVPKDAQKKALRGGVDIVVATPGRLIDLMEEGACDISNVSYLVLDEADRMLDIGFEQAVRSIISRTRPDRQTLMFSATWPESVRKLALDFQRAPVKVTIGSPDLSASQNVTQIVEVMANPNDKEGRLMQLLEKYHKSRKNRVLVFALYKKEATRVESVLARRGYKVVAIHGDKNQYQRTEALGQFKGGSFPLMIATDVAARGLDIPDVEVSHSGELINVLKQANQVVPEDLLKFGGTVKKKEHSAYGAFFKDVDATAKPTKIVFADD
ncbi:P-loop containing nucleoside triphosphate hydrolase protein [Jimgerdemannia flammicorona]|uniref:RNA helicase n=2 Tax=Jimgerdemannia flammicorona TaxID=994334 RepID=A0A433QJ74_9FUNG|nr:P-loop containing nucleoside triphosphate hydrolase protein [Jimgerdemannia flammicorona]RUS29824.1 P-loop containing nucleoside triphosphate hydrolase protein [Jimgerdemannia flammicorona]